jgi:predicted esterase
MNIIKKISKLAIIIASLNCINTFSTPRFTPSLESLHVHTLITTNEIPKSAKPVSIRTFISQSANDEKKITEGYIQIRSKTTKELENKIITAHKGIALDPQTKLVIIASRGYTFNITLGEAIPRKGGGLLDAYQRIRDNIFHAPAITFDYPDDRALFNFGQKLDQRCLEFVYQEVHKQCPHAKIILFGSCRGAKCVLEYATKKPKNLAAIILESPFISAKEMTLQIGKNYAPIIPGAATLTYGIFKMYFPNFKDQKETLRRRLHRTPNVPIFIAHRTHDTLVSNRQVHDLIRLLKKGGISNIYFFTTEDEAENHAPMTLNLQI